MASNKFRLLVAVAASLFLSLALAAAERFDKALVQREQQEQYQTPYAEAADKKPLKDWLKSVREALEKGELDLSAATRVVIEAERTPEGELANPAVVELNGDQKLRPYVQSFITALSDSRALRSLQDVGRVRFVFDLTGAELNVEARLETPTSERASSLARQYGLLVKVARATQKGKPEAALYDKLKASADEKDVLVRLSLTRDEAARLLEKLSAR